MAVLVGVEWIVAALAPSTIAPHPNFSVKVVAPVELLALLADGRDADFDRYTVAGEGRPTGSSLDIQLVMAVRDSLRESTQEKGVQRLVEFLGSSDGRDAPVGQIAAASLFAGVGLGELDRLAEAVAVLERTAERLAFEADGQGGGSRALVHAAVRQQLVLRLFEGGRRSDAAAQARAVEAICPARSSRFDRVDMSRGSPLTATQVQVDLSKMLRAHARASRVPVEQGKLWVSVLKSPLPTADAKSARDDAEAGRQFVKEVFESRVSWARHRTRFATGDPVDGPASTALLHAELSGDVGAARRRREGLGLIRALRTAEPSSVWATTEGIRLLRQADAREPLEDMLRAIRAQGPVAPLASAARSVLSRKTLLSSVTRCDLVVINAAAELLEGRELAFALRAVRTYRSAPAARIGAESFADWAVADFSWRVAARLLPGSGRDAAVAKAVLADLESGHISQPLTNTLESMVRTIEWPLVHKTTRTRWLAWATSQDDPELFGLAMAILDEIQGVGRHEVGPPRPEGLALAIRLLQEQAHEVVALGHEVEAASSACKRRLKEIRDAAATGSYSFGGLSAPEIAVLLATEFGQTDLWHPLFELLLDPLVAPSDKSSALQRMAILRGEVPDALLDKVTGNPLFALRSVAVDHFDKGRLPIMPEALRFAAAYDLISQDALISATTQLAGSGRPYGRLEAARTIPHASGQTGSTEWGAVLLLQLSHDVDAVVRSEAARSLATVRNRYDGVASAVYKRINELLQADGILVPLLTLRGLRVGGSVPADVMDLASRFANDHPVRVIREAASALVSESGGPVV